MSTIVDAVVKEALRLRTVIPRVGRVVQKRPFALGGYSAPPGMEIDPSIRTIHRRADLYPQPGRFIPERFLGADAPDTYTWLPFGGGTRRCLGASFALTEMRVVLDRVLQRAQLIAADAKPLARSSGSSPSGLAAAFASSSPARPLRLSSFQRGNRERQVGEPVTACCVRSYLAKVRGSSGLAGRRAH